MKKFVVVCLTLAACTTPNASHSPDATNAPNQVAEGAASANAKVSNPTTKNGSRLRHYVYTFSDGATVVSDQPLRDTQLNMDCYLSTASDGVLRCLPSGSFFPSVMLSDNSICSAFADANCTEPIGTTGIPGENQSSIVSYWNGTATQYNELGPAFSGSFYCQSYDHSCAAASAPIAPTNTAPLYRLGGIVQLDSFVSSRSRY